MGPNYEALLEAVLQHVEELKAQGIRHLPATLQSLAAFDSPTPQARRRLPAKTAPVISSATSLQSGVKDSGIGPDPEAKAAAMAELRGRALVCQKCPHLAQSRKNVVFGTGDINSPLLFVGEAPGAEEDEQGEPFVGAAGQLLTRIIRAMGFSRETVYIANILKCRPDTPAQTFGNRKPTPEEMKTCLPYLVAQIELIQPKVIVALGATAAEGLLGLNVGISKLRGRFQSFHGVPVMPTFHPSYLLRSEAPNVKRQVWEDMLQVLEKLDVAITEKQRNYFLKEP